MSQTKIEWAERVWNPVTGCSKISDGCKFCYAERMSKRLAGRFGYPKDDPFRVTLRPDRLDEPLKWHKPSRIFVCSMGDLFHEDVPDDFIHDVLRTVFILPKHQFLVLTKRPERAKEYFSDYYAHGKFGRNLWLGVTAENQEQADKRIPILLQIPAEKRFVSIEPMLGAVDISEYLSDDDYQPPRFLDEGETYSRQPKELIDWVILGAESGPKRRYCDSENMITIARQCNGVNIPVFVKQIHLWKRLSRLSDGFYVEKDINKFPPHLQIRQYPEVV